ncbi:MAG TPA: nickel-dependent hydrogenase large subunit [Vicinamibacterales bacterium]|jgi:hydrogenase large subunit|nr:nickel-dependent hydrogenase large subunit [Vicinamibacterales bacterium]
MSRHITVDPITRIEGHLRIDVEVDGGAVTKAWSSGQMFRGIERILLGRDPRDAWLFTQRFCGVCTTVHAITSVRAVENALGLEVPLNAQYIRNLIVAAHAMHDHIVHFYHLSALDWVDVVSALKADVAKAAALGEKLSPWPGNSRQQLQAVKDRLAGFVAGGQLGIFANGYWGHPAMKLAPEVNLLAVAHYLEALEYQRKVNQVVALLGGKTPNIQNLAVGGVANAINLDNQATLNMEKLFYVKQRLDEIKSFIEQVYFVDVCAVGAMYADWLGYGKGVTNYLAVPDFPLDTKGTSFDMPGGTIMNGDLKTIREIKRFDEPYFRENVSENIAHAWYAGDWTRHPWDEETVPKYTGYKPDGKYSWVKAPRFDGKVMQVGPLAQVLVAFTLGHEPTVKWATKTLETAGTIAGAKLGPEVLHSTLGRHAARMIRTAVISELATRHWELLVENIGKGDVAIFNKPVFPKGEQRGFGFHEAPRGTLSHWIVIEDGKIANYQAVVPSTWNAGPRDDKGQPGPYEASLVGNPVADPERPLEVLRTIHSFDPCLACAIHTVDVGGNELARVRAL